MSNSKKIMYASDEAAKKVTLTGWLADGRFFGENEHLARYAGCTHDICDCGKEKTKHYTKCESCRAKSSREKFLSIPFEIWDGKSPVCLPDGDQYFFDSDEIEDYINEQKEFDEDFPDDIDLLICYPVPLRTVDFDHFSDEMHEDWEPSQKLINAVKAINEVIESEPTQSWMPGKKRTIFSI